ncbi:MAG: LON peptidase substrate-binding domain-containing protein, partial [Dehalococcoidia bacterium]
MVVTLMLETSEAKAAVAAARDGDNELVLVPRLEQRYARIGTVAKIEDVGRLQNGLDAMVVRGLARVAIGTGVAGTGDGTWVQVDQAEETNQDTAQAKELAKNYRGTVEAIADQLGLPQIAQAVRGVREPGALADLAGYAPELGLEQKVEILETLDVEQRLEKVLGWAKESLAEMTVKTKIREEVQEGLDKRQREFILRQQLEAIQKELGEITGETDGDVAAEYRAKIEQANMPEGALKEAERELGRLERTSEQSPEYGWIRTYLDWMTELPWDVRTDDNLDITEARKILDQDHTGLDDVKDRIIEYLAVRKLRADRGLTEATAGRGSGAILTLVGPPGVGKTSLGESVARALGRKFVRVSLGGIHDEAEIR